MRGIVACTYPYTRTYTSYVPEMNDIAAINGLSWSDRGDNTRRGTRHLVISRQIHDDYMIDSPFPLVPCFFRFRKLVAIRTRTRARRRA